MTQKSGFRLGIALLALVLIVGLAGPGPVLAQGGAFLGVGLVAQEDGALIAEIIPGTGAEAAELQVDDLITAWNGQPVNLETPLPTYVADHAPGDEVVLTVVRDSETLEITATLGTRPEDSVAAPVVLPAGMIRGRRMTLDFTDILYSGALLTVFNVPEYSAMAGALEPGDRITAIDGENVFNLNYVEITSRMLRGGLITVDVVRGEQPLRLLLNAPQDSFSLMEITVVDVNALLEENSP